jgi:hypothetical protein
MQKRLHKSSGQGSARSVGSKQRASVAWEQLEAFIDQVWFAGKWNVAHAQPALGTGQPAQPAGSLRRCVAVELFSAILIMGMGRRVGRVTPCAPVLGRLRANGAHGVKRPTNLVK